MDVVTHGELALAGMLGALLAGACLAGAWPRAARAVSAITLLAALLPALWLAAAVSDGGTVSLHLGGWAPPLGIGLSADGLAALLLPATLVLMLAAMATPVKRPPEPGFWMLWTWTGVALAVVFTAADLFNAYVALELLGICAAGLVALAGTRDALLAAMRYLLVGLTGSALYLFGVALLYARTGVLDLTLVAAGGGDGLALGLMTAGLLMKAAAFPFHGWLAPAHGNAPAPASAVLSGLVVKAGIVLAWRLWEALGATAGDAAPAALTALGAGAIVWGGVQALRANRLKVLLAFSTVAQMGYLVIVLALVTAGEPGARAAGVLLLLSHALAKTAAFGAAGAVIATLGSDRLEHLRGTASRLPLTTFAYGAAAVALVGLPPAGSFLGKWLLLEAAAAGGHWLAAAAIVAGTVLSAAYLLRPLSLAFDATGESRPAREPGAAIAVTVALAGAALLAGGGAVAALGGAAEVPA